MIPPFWGFPVHAPEHGGILRATAPTATSNSRWYTRGASKANKKRKKRQCMVDGCKNATDCPGAYNRQNCYTKTGIN